MSAANLNSFSQGSKRKRGGATIHLWTAGCGITVVRLIQHYSQTTFLFMRCIVADGPFGGCTTSDSVSIPANTINPPSLRVEPASS